VGGGGVTAPNDSAFVLENDTDGANDALLSNRRILTAGAGITLTDSGAGGALTVAASVASGEVQVLFAATADDSIQNTTVRTNFAPTGVGSATLPANSLKVGQVYRITARGVLSTA